MMHTPQRSPTFELNSLRIFDLNDEIKGRIDIIQCEKIKLLPIVPRLVKVIQKHLTHLVYWTRGIDWTLEAQFTDEVGQQPQVEHIRVAK